MTATRERSFGEVLARIAAIAARRGYAAELAVALRDARGDDRKIDELIRRLEREARR